MLQYNLCNYLNTTWCTNIFLETSTVASIVSDLLADCDSTIKVSKVLHDELQEMARQLVVIQQQCNAKDRPLCFTVQFSGFDITLPLNEVSIENQSITNIMWMARFLIPA